MAILVSVGLRRCSAIRPYAKFHRTGPAGPEKVQWPPILGPKGRPIAGLYTAQGQDRLGKNEPSAQVRAAGRSLVMSKIFSKMLVGTGSNRSGSME